MSFKYIVEGWLMPSVSLFGLGGNFMSMFILHHREVKLKKDFVDVLCMLATFDNLLLLSTFFLFSLPTLSDSYQKAVRSYLTNSALSRISLKNPFTVLSIHCTLPVSVDQHLYDGLRLHDGGRGRQSILGYLGRGHLKQ